MAMMWLTTFAVALVALAEVGSYPTTYQAPTSLADLPIDCPFHREPIGFDHIGDTAYGTATQTGNYEFSKIPGNLYESGQDYTGYVQNNPYVSQAQEFPYYQQNYQQPQSYPQEYQNYYQPQQFQEYNQYQPEESYASVLPYYGEQNYYNQQPYYGEQTPEYGYGNQNEDGYMSILPYYGEQTPEETVQYIYQEEAPEECDDANYGEQIPQQNLQYVYQEAPEECDDQTPDYVHVVEVIDNCKSNLNAIYEGACEEITEAEETAATRIEKSRALVASKSFEDFGLESDSDNPGFMRGLFSLFKPQNLISMPMKAVSTGMDTFVLSPLQAISKAPAPKVVEVKKPTPVRAPVNLAQSVKPVQQIAKPVQVPKAVAPVAESVKPVQLIAQPVQVPVKDVPKSVTPVAESVKPVQLIAEPIQVPVKDVVESAVPVEIQEIQEQNIAESVEGIQRELEDPKFAEPEVVENFPDPAEVEERQAAARASCLRSVSNDLNRQFQFNNQEANQCINNAEARFQQSVYMTRYNVNQQRANFENRNNYEAQRMTMCASQNQQCQEEEELLKKTAEDFATNVNNDLAEISNAEDILQQELTICDANAETRHAELRDEANFGKANC